MSQHEIKVPDVSVIRTESSALVAEARALRVTSHEEYAVAGEFIQRCARLRKNVVELFAEPTAAADKLHKFLTGLRGQLCAVPDEARAIAEAPMKSFLREEERRRREEQARREAEEKAKQEDALQDEALELEAGGQHEAAEQVISTPVVAPVIDIARPKADGVSHRKCFTFRVLDASKLDRKFLMADEKKIRQTVNALGLDAAGVVGEGAIEILEDLNLSARA